MGAGIAFEFRLRYPDMYKRYVELCAAKEIDIGMLWLYKADDRWILNFPTKKNWKFPSKQSYLHAGLRKFVETHRSRGISSIAFPVLGADRGGIDPDESIRLMRSYLDPLEIDIEIYRYDPTAEDDLYIQVRDRLLDMNIDELSSLTRLRRDYVQKVIDAMNRSDVFQLNQLSRIKGIGTKTLEKLFAAARKEMEKPDISHQRFKQSQFRFE